MDTIAQTNGQLAETDKIEFGNIAASSGAASRLVIASYNIRYAAGKYLISGGLLRRVGLLPTGRRSENIARNIDLAAKAFSSGRLLPTVDVLALQEADKETGRAGRHHIARELAESLEMAWIHVPSGLPRGVEPQKRQWWFSFEEQIELYDQGDTGLGLLSRYPIQDVVRIDLPWSECPWRPRLSVGATIRVGNETICLFNSHIDPHSSAGGQIEQLEVVLEHALKSDRSIFLGDFNTLSKRKCLEVRRLLESAGYETPFPTGTPTWRGAGLRMHADWIFVRNLKVGRWGVARPLGVSDHWPIWIEIQLGSDGYRLK